MRTDRPSAHISLSWPHPACCGALASAAVVAVLLMGAHTALANEAERVIDVGSSQVDVGATASTTDSAEGALLDAREACNAPVSVPASPVQNVPEGQTEPTDDKVTEAKLEFPLRVVAPQAQADVEGQGTPDEHESFEDAEATHAVSQTSEFSRGAPTRAPEETIETGPAAPSPHMAIVTRAGTAGEEEGWSSKPEATAPQSVKATQPEVDEPVAPKLVANKPTGKKPAVKYLNMFRLYNPNSGEHFYTSSQKELKTVCEAGWRYEGVGWVSPDSGAAVFRLYNPNAGDHHYTTSSRERDGLVRAGWRYEGIGWRSEGDDGTAVLRQYNPNARAGAHNFTVSPQEAKHLVAAGWRDEGRAWFASRQATQPIKGFWMVTSAWGSKQRYWVGSDAQLARERVVTPSEGAGYYAYASSDGSILRGVRDLGDGYAMVADDDGRLLAAGGEGFSKLRGADGRERLYYLHYGGEGFSLARVGHFERGGKHFWGQASDGSILRGKLRQGKGMLVANPTTGALLWSRGMVVTGEYDDGELQRYYVDDSVGAGLLGARLGLFTYDGKRYYGREDQGYVVRGTYVVSRYYAKTHGSFPGDWHDDTVAIADNDGVLVSREEFGRRIVSAARTMLGGSYSYDDSAYYPDRRAFNCSGFTWWVYSTLGINLSHNQGYFSYYAQQDNRNDSQMWGVEKRAGWKTSIPDLRPGDLVFFSPLQDKYHTGHVGVYIGDGKMIDSNTPDGVQVRNVWRTSYVGGGLPITLV